MRDRTHGKESKTKKEIYEARIDAKKTWVHTNRQLQ